MKRSWKMGIVLFGIVLTVCIFPLCLVRRDTNVDPSLDGAYQRTGQVEELLQTFVAQTSYLSGLEFDIGFPEGKPEAGALTVNVMKEDGKVIARREVDLEQVQDSAFTYVPIGKWIKKGGFYSFSVSQGGSDQPVIKFQAIYTTEAKDHTPGNQELYADGESVSGQAVVRYVYGFPLNVKNVVCLWTFVWMICLCAIECIGGGKTVRQNRYLQGAERLLERWQIPILAAELVVVTAMIVRICQNEAVDWDEAFTWQITTKNTVAGMLQATAADVHPPLYYVLVMGAIALFGKNIFVVKMVTVAGYVATGLLGIFLVRKRWGVKTAIPFILVSGLGSQMIYYNVNLRMYSWMIFFVLAAGLFAYEIMQSGKIGWWAAFTLVSLGGVYTQYFAVVPLALLYLFLFVWIIVNDRSQIKKWVLCCAATVAGYLPWLSVVLGTLKRDAGSERTESLAHEVGNIMEWAFKNNIEYSAYLPVVLFAAAVLCLIVEWKKYGRNEKAFLGFSAALFLAAFGLCMLIASYTQHFWHNRYLVDVLLFVWLFMLIVLGRRSILAWGAGMIWIGIWSLSAYVIAGDMELRTVPWLNNTKELLAQVQGEEKVVYNFPTFDVMYEYFLPNAEFIWYEDVDFSVMGEEFYMIQWGGRDFDYMLYQEGILERENLGTIRMEEGVIPQLWRITFHGVEK